jgi:hypothetical protein
MHEGKKPEMALGEGRRWRREKISGRVHHMYLSPLRLGILIFKAGL